MLFQLYVGRTVSICASDSLGIISNIDDPVLHSFEGSRVVVDAPKHSTLLFTSTQVSAMTVTFCLKYISVMGVLKEAFDVLRQFNMDNEWGSALEIAVSHFDILQSVP